MKVLTIIALISAQLISNLAGADMARSQQQVGRGSVISFKSDIVITQKNYSRNTIFKKYIVGQSKGIAVLELTPAVANVVAKLGDTMIKAGEELQISSFQIENRTLYTLPTAIFTGEYVNFHAQYVISFRGQDQAIGILHIGASDARKLNQSELLSTILDQVITIKSLPNIPLLSEQL